MEIKCIHRMRRTDRMERLSAYYHVPVCMIMRANSFASPQDIFLCREVKIPEKSYCNMCGFTKARAMEFESYTIKPSDTLYGIAKSYGLTMSIILKANGIKDPGMIRAGDSLNIPLLSGYLYCARSGETIQDIARKHNVTESSLREKNFLSQNDQVFPGMRLLVG